MELPPKDACKDYCPPRLWVFMLFGVQVESSKLWPRLSTRFQLPATRMTNVDKYGPVLRNAVRLHGSSIANRTSEAATHFTTRQAFPQIRFPHRHRDMILRVPQSRKTTQIPRDLMQQGKPQPIKLLTSLF